MKFCILLPGKIKPVSLVQAQDDYLSRIKRRLKCDVIQYKDARIDSRSTEIIKRAEAEQIEKKLKPNDNIIALDESGIRLTSKKLSEKIRPGGVNSQGRTVFIIGGALGLDASILERANEVWRLSDLTLAGGIARIVFFEALYRADTINKNEPYHNS